MSKPPLTWDASGKLVPLTEEEARRQDEEAQRLRGTSRKDLSVDRRVIASSWDTGFWTILRDVGHLGMEASPSARKDLRPTIFIPSATLTGLSFLLWICVVTLGIVCFPLSYAVSKIGEAGLAWSLRRALDGEEAKGENPYNV